MAYYPPNNDFDRAVNEVLDKRLSEKIFDVLWKRLFHYQTFFESLDGFGGSNRTLLNDEVTLTTLQTTGSEADIFKSPDQQGLITFSQPSRFKSSFLFDNVYNQTTYITIGDIEGGGQGYGFKIANGVIYGVTHDGSTENAVTLLTISAAAQVTQRYTIEARYLPSQKVLFLLDDAANSVPITEFGVSVSNLPSPVAAVNENLFRAVVKLTTGAQNFATTDVNTSTEQITLGTAYPTGTAIQFTTTGGLPAGLSLATVYYSIKVDATHIKVASSLANALAGTAIDLTSQGTGTHTATPDANNMKISFIDYLQMRNILK